MLHIFVSSAKWSVTLDLGYQHFWLKNSEEINKLSVRRCTPLRQVTSTISSAPHLMCHTTSVILQQQLTPNTNQYWYQYYWPHRVVMNSDKALLIIMSCCLLICFILIYSLITSKNFHSTVKSLFDWQSWNHHTSLNRAVLQCRSLVLVASDIAPLNQTQVRLGSP